MKVLQIEKGKVFSFRVESSFEFPGWTSPVRFGVVHSEQGLAPGSIPEETLEIVPCFKSMRDEALRANHVRIGWEPISAKTREEVNLIDCDCGLVRTIPRSWLLREEGSISNANLKQIEDGVELYL